MQSQSPVNILTISHLQRRRFSSLWPHLPCHPQPSKLSLPCSEATAMPRLDELRKMCLKMSKLRCYYQKHLPLSIFQGKSSFEHWTKFGMPLRSQDRICGHFNHLRSLKKRRHSNCLQLKVSRPDILKSSHNWLLVVILKHHTMSSPLASKSKGQL